MYAVTIENPTSGVCRLNRLNFKRVNCKYDKKELKAFCSQMMQMLELLGTFTSLEMQFESQNI